MTIRAIAREMGMTAPAVYRYFSSRDALIMQLRVDIFTEMAEYMRTVIGEIPESESAPRLIASARALRVWAIKHPHEFGLTLGPWAPGLGREETKPERATGWSFASLIVELVGSLWHERGFPRPRRRSSAPTWWRS
ncbi:TetR/AcrR family transcriptional regulator [Streptomyces sp. M19]